MGISSANQQGQARCLLDTGADEHICPASFASWIKPESRTSGPRLRDAQGKVMQHGNNYRKIMLCVKTVEGMQLSIPVTFLIGPVQQPIISMGRLEDDLKANLDTKRRVLKVGEHKVDVDRVMRSYHLPVWLDKPKAEGQLEQIRQVKRLETKGNRRRPDGLSVQRLAHRVRRGRPEPRSTGTEPVVGHAGDVEEMSLLKLLLGQQGQQRLPAQRSRNTATSGRTIQSHHGGHRHPGP